MLINEQQAGVPQANEADPAYALFRDQSRFWIQRVAVPLLMVIGLFGNSITVIIMTRRRMRSTTNMYLAALAFVDMLYLVLTFLLGLSHYPNMAGREHYIYWKLRPFLMMLTDACSNTSVWLTVTFTIERYIAVRYPMKGKVWCTEVRAKMLIVCVFVFGILFASPVPFEWQVVEKKVLIRPISVEQTLKSSHQVLNSSESINLNKDKTSQVIGGMVDDRKSFKEKQTFELENTYNTILTLDYSNFGRNETYKTIYYWSTAVIFYFIPLFSLMLFNGFLIISVHQSKRERTRMVKPTESSSHYSNSNLTTTNFVSNGKTGNQSISYPEFADNLSSEYRRFKSSIFTSSRNKRKHKTRDSLVIKEAVHDSPSIQAFGEEKSVSSSQPKQTADFPKLVSEASNSVSSVPLVLTPSKRMSELNVQINCDKEPVTGDKKNTGEIRREYDNQASYDTSIQNERTSLETGNKTSRDMIKTIGGLPITRSISLKRTLTTNSSSKSLTHPASIAPVSSQERRITIMLIAVVILFLICQIPSAAMLLYTSVRELVPNTNEHALVLAFGNIFNFLMAMNAAGNFILYSFLSKKYRRTFMMLFCKCLGSKRKNSAPKRVLSVRFETSGQSLRNSTSIYQNNKFIDKVQKDTPL